MKVVSLIVAGALCSGFALSDVLISQYYEGSSFNKWIELTNTAAGEVSLDGYVLTSWNNSSREAWKLGEGSADNEEALTGLSIPGNGYLLIGNSQAVLPEYASRDQASDTTNLNGDDSVVLYNTALGAVGDTSAIADAICFLNRPDGENKSFYRLTVAQGYDLLLGSSVLDFGDVWGQKTITEVDEAAPSEDWYLKNLASTATEQLSVSLSPVAISEDAGEGVVDVTVERSGGTAEALTVTLLSSDESEALIPIPEQEIPAGEVRATFPMVIDAVDDDAPDGTQVVTISVSAPGFASGVAELEVTDDGDRAPIVINEVLWDPPSGSDPNGDGNPNGSPLPAVVEDEFVELVNVSGASFDLTGFELHDFTGMRHVFPETVLANGQAVVVFGGGVPTGEFGGSLVQVASTGALGLNNDGDMVVLKSPGGEGEVVSFEYAGADGDDFSLTRDPDAEGPFVPHVSATGSGGAAFSPGTQVDGSAFDTLLELPGPPLVIASLGENLVFTWESLSGKLYTLRSETDPSVTEPAAWPIFDGNSEIAATPPANTLTLSRPPDSVRFFVLEEFDAPPVAILSDDFESGAGDWTVGSEGEAGTAWELGVPSNVGPAAARSGVHCFGTNLAGDYELNADLWLRSPALDLTAAGGATLHWSQFYDIEAGFDAGAVRVLNAADDTLVASVGPPIDGVVADWEEVSLRLPAAALGQRIKIEFRFTSDDVSSFAGWYVDDIEVTVP